MKKKAIILLLVLTISAVVSFDIFGGAIRTLLSIEITTVSPEYEVYDGAMCIVLPESAVMKNRDGEDCIYSVVPAEDRHEKAYEVVEISVTAEIESGKAYIPARDMPNINKAAITNEVELSNGVRVKIIK